MKKLIMMLTLGFAAALSVATPVVANPFVLGWILEGAAARGAVGAAGRGVATRGLLGNVVIGAAARMVLTSTLRQHGGKVLVIVRRETNVRLDATVNLLPVVLTYDQPNSAVAGYIADEVNATCPDGWGVLSLEFGHIRLSCN